MAQSAVWNKNYFKIVLLGEGRVGKTSLLLRFVENEFDEKQQSTVNPNYLDKEIQVSPKDKVKLSIWDTAGQEKFRALAPLYYREAEGAVIIFDMGFRESLNALKKWSRELRQFAKNDIVTYICANKCDLPEKQISEEEGRTLANQLGAKFYLTSAKKNLGVTEMFESIASEIYQKLCKSEKNKPKLLGQSTYTQERQSYQIESNKKQNKDSRKGCC